MSASDFWAKPESVIKACLYFALLEERILFRFNQIFALPFNKVSCISVIKINEFILHYSQIK